jgi:BirA family transcriptional regulator, biotin operon repressor / biotin---[acetyl-CoA-carboxylase] ligase
MSPVPPSSSLETAAVMAALRHCALGHTIHATGLTGSTNDDARELARHGAAHGTLVVADAQTSGRGRRGAAWLSAPGKNLLLSLILRPSLPLAAWPQLATVAAVAVADAVRPWAPHARIKWPNDIHLGPLKVAGLLVESTLTGEADSSYVILGLGLNVSATADDFPPELRGIATSLIIADPTTHPTREKVIISLCHSLAQRLTEWSADGFTSIRGAAEARSNLMGQEVRAEIGPQVIIGTATGLTEDGALILATSDGREILTSVDRLRRLS